MVITDIAECVKNKDRVNVYIDGVFAFAVYKEIAVSGKIKKGVDISDAQIQAIKSEDSRKYAFSTALHYVTYKQRTEKEVRDKLRQKGVDGAAIEEALEKLREYGYVDDEAYAALYAEELNVKFGKRMIRQKMKLKGISDELITCALENIEGENPIVGQLERYEARYPNDEPKKREQKIIRALMTKGFEYDDIRRAMTEMKE